MNKLRHYILNSVQFLLENPLTLVMLSTVLSMTYESYRLVNIINEPHNLNPQTLAMFEEFFKTPFGSYLVLGSVFAYFILYTVLFFLMLYTTLRIIRFLLIKKGLTMDYLHDEQRREQLYRLYYYNAKRFEISNTPLKCGECRTNLSKLDYIKNFGYCNTCRQELDKKTRKFTSEQQSECLAYLRENGLIK